MGAANSRRVSRPSSPRVNHTNRFSLSSLLLCGGSTSRAAYEIEDHPTELLVDSATDFNDAVEQVCEESSLSHCTEARISSSRAETATFFDSSIQSCENATLEDSSRSVATSSQRECLFQSKELVPPHEVSADHSHNESYRDSSNTASTSFVKRQSSDTVSVNSSANKDAVNNIDNPGDSSIPQISHETLHLRSSPPQVYEESSSSEIYVESHSSTATAFQNSDSNPSSQVSNLPVTSQLPENESHDETIPSGLGFLVPNRERGHINESVLHVDVVTISSNTSSHSNADAIDHNARRHGRRLFWDAFSQRSSRRSRISPTIVFSVGDPDDLVSQDRWLLDLSSGFSNNEVGEDFEYFGSRIHRSNARMLHSRSEIWGRLRGGLNETDQWNTSCPLGLHPDGMCSCEPFPTTEESGNRASMSRVVMLAEALFEFLDEIHRQPVSFSLSAVTPAPESVVDSFPLKCHKMVDASGGGSNSEQCYICLGEYEEGDKIRVLPCNHEYHMGCVDKWLKEIHGICPLCRGNVCGGFTESSASNTEVSP